MPQFAAFTRPWSQWGAEACFRGAAAAGYDGVGLMGGRVFSRDSTPAELDALRATLDALGAPPLANMPRVPLDGTADDIADAFRAEIDAALKLSVRDLVLLGAHRPETYPIYLDGCKAAAPYAAERGVRLGLKPHGGLTLTSEDLLRCVQYVDSPAFGISYDAGNLIHYAEQPPTWLLDEMLPHIVSMCVKDIRGGKGGDVNIEPGTGVCDLPAIFARLQAGGFDGPYVVECLGGATEEDILERAQRTLANMRAWLA